MTAQLPIVSYSAKLTILEPTLQAQIVSTLQDPDARPVHPCMTAYINSRGGRVIVHAWDYASAIGPVGVSFHNPVRQRQFQSAVHWLFRGRAPLLVRGDGAWPLTLRKDLPGETLLGMTNLSLDPWPAAELEFAMPGKIAELHSLESNGSWCPLDPERYQVDNRVGTLVFPRIHLDRPQFVWIKWQPMR